MIGGRSLTNAHIGNRLRAMLGRRAHNFVTIITSLHIEFRMLDLNSLS